MGIIRLGSMGAAALAGLTFSPAMAADLSFGDFTGAGASLSINGNAAVAADAANRQVLRLTPAAEGQAGSAFSQTPILLTSDYAFSTRFTFNINGNGGIAPADGLVFVIQPNSSSVGTGGSGIGIAGIANSFGVEFDTFPAFGNDLSEDHVGIDVGTDMDSNGDLTSRAQAGVGNGYLSSGQDLTAWIDYDGTTVEVRLGSASTPRPIAALLSYDIDLAGIVGGGDAFVGFTSATGSGYSNHDIVNWTFRDSFDPIASDAPEPSTWAMLILGFGLVGATLRRGRTLLPDLAV